MSATNSTPTINLPLFIGTDKPAWLTDWNGSMNTIDGAIATLQTAESGTATALAALSQSVTALSGTVEQHTTAIQTVTTATATNTGSINTITSLIGNGEPTTEDKTIIGAINEIYAEIGGGEGVEASEVTYSNTSSGLTATDVQAAIDEVNAKIPQGGSVDADDVSYDNTQSGLTAANVQAAIDEVNTGVASVASDVEALQKTVFPASSVDLSGYTSTLYEYPSDGYVTVDVSSNFKIYGSSATAGTDPGINMTTSSSEVQSTFVRKGMKGQAKSGHAYFYGLS